MHARSLLVIALVSAAALCAAAPGAFAVQSSSVKAAVQKAPVKKKNTVKPAVKKKAASKSSKSAPKRRAVAKEVGAVTDNIDAARAQQQETQGNIEKIRSSIESTSQDREKIRSELKKSETEIRAVRQKLRTIRTQRSKAERELGVQKRRVVSLESELALEQRALESINRQRVELQTQTKSPGWASSDPNQAMRRETMLQILAKRSQEAIKRLEKSQKALNKALADSKRTGDKLNKMLSAEREEQTRLNKERRERQRTAAKLDRELIVLSGSLQKLKKDEARLGNLITNIQKREAAKQSKALASAVQRKASDFSGTAATKVQPAAAAGLISPVQGDIAARYGQKRGNDDKMGTWKGTLFSVTGDKPVYAVRGGKVVFADYLKGYGNLLIIDHGKGYFSVYGNNAELEKDIGDSVRSGEVISRVGKGSGSVSVLYFEMRHNGKPIDPTGWINL